MHRVPQPEEPPSSCEAASRRPHRGAAPPSRLRLSMAKLRPGETAMPSELSSISDDLKASAVVSNGIAVLGLGNIGPLAAKPVMEGKAVLFKKFAGIDVFDIEIAAHEVEHVVEVVAALEPTFGGINLED